MLGGVDAQIRSLRKITVAAGDATLLCLSIVFGCRGFGGCGLHDAVEVTGEGALERGNVSGYAEVLDESTRLVDM